MSIIKSSADHLTLNADGASKDIKFQANGVEVASISSAGVITGDGSGLTGIATGADTSLSNLSSAGQEQVCSAWVNFNGTGTVAIRDSFNVSSITDNGAGDYSISFTTSIGIADYAILMSLGAAATGAASVFNRSGAVAHGFTQPTTSGFRIKTGHNYYTASAFYDRPYINIAIFA